MRVATRLSALVLCITVSLVAGGCGGGNVPGAVVQAQTSSTPAILSASCPVLSNVAGTINWLFPLGNINADCVATGPNPAGMPMPSAGTLKNLRFVAGLGAAATDTGIVTVFINGSATALACTASATLASGATDATCSDTTHTISIAAGDQVAVQVVMQAGTFGVVRATLEKQ